MLGGAGLTGAAEIEDGMRVPTRCRLPNIDEGLPGVLPRPFFAPTYGAIHEVPCRHKSGPAPLPGAAISQNRVLWARPERVNAGTA